MTAGQTDVIQKIKNNLNKSSRICPIISEYKNIKEGIEKGDF